MCRYGENVVKKRGPIPAHLLGNMWAQTWDNIQDFMLPFPNRESTDITPNMIKQVRFNTNFLIKTIAQNY
jgi:peptidyl-dipeptidase A